MAKRQFEDQWRQGRVEFIPVEWRTWLQLDKGRLKIYGPTPYCCHLIGMVDSLTLPNVRTIRNIVNTSLLDVMYYLSPTYGPEVWCVWCTYVCL